MIKKEIRATYHGKGLNNFIESLLKSYGCENSIMIEGSLIDNYIIYGEGIVPDFTLIPDLSEIMKKNWKYIILKEKVNTMYSSYVEVIFSNNDQHPLLNELEEIYNKNDTEYTA